MRLPAWTGWGNKHPEPRYHGTRVWLTGKLAARVMFAAFLVFGTYNPGGRSWFHWMRDSAASATWKLIVSFLLVIAYGVALPVVWRALGFGGIVLTTALATTTSWALVEAGWISLAAPNAPIWIGLAVVAFVVGVGLCWMLFGRILDGQLRTRDISR
jgi:hypothetical protein